MKYQSNAFSIATIYAFRNQPDEAFEWLDRDSAQRDPSLMATNLDPLTEQPAQGPAIYGVLEEAQPAELILIPQSQLYLHSGLPVSIITEALH